MTANEIQAGLDRIMAAVGEHAASDRNPCGVVAHYEHGHLLPWVVADDWYSEYFETVEAAERAAREWVDRTPEVYR